MTMQRTRRRTGAVLPLVTVCLVGLIGFVALAIDIGMMAVARTQAQNAVDVAALAGARTLNGLAGNNRTLAEAEAREAAKANSVLTTPIVDSQITLVTSGVYRYDTTQNRFIANFATTPTANEAWGVMQVNLLTDQQTYFGRIFGVNSMQVGASATAVHRPRDISIVLDFSGSMKFSSEFNWPGASSSTNTSGALNPDPTFPRFGPWKVYPIATGTTWNPMQRLHAYVDGGGETHAVNNMTIATTNGPPIVTNFQTNQGAVTSGTNAFCYQGNWTPGVFNKANTPVCTPTPNEWVSQYAALYDGDRWPLKLGLTTTTPALTDYAVHVGHVMNITTFGTGHARNANWENNGYDYSALASWSNGPYRGYVMGPGYYGKSFYVWPPDPRYDATANPATVSTTHAAKDGSGKWIADWRKRFFRVRGTGARVDNNATLFSSTGVWKNQNVGTSANYIVDYDAVLAWLKDGAQVLPPSLRAGRVLYYSSIPTTIPVDINTGMITSAATEDQRFWKEYIDFVIGSGRHNRTKTLYGYGSNNTWNGQTFGTGKITDRTTMTANPKPYMAYDDVPVHPRAHMWFGPLTMLGFLSIDSDNLGFNWFAGTTYEAQTWQLKAGIQSSLQDIKNNHPNDLAMLTYFSHHNNYANVRVAMGKNYDRMTNALFYPFSLLNSLGTVSAEKRPYLNATPSTGNPSGLNPSNYQADIPLADGGTNPTMGLMTAYNQFNWVGSSGGVNYTGRNGAAKVVILETDGVANQTCNGTFTSTTSGRAHWTSISNGSGVGNGHPDACDAAVTMAWIICQDTGGTKPWPAGFPSGTTRTRRYTSVAGPGFSSTRTPARVHTLAFGELFEATTTSTAKTTALKLLLDIQYVGGTSPAGSTSIESYKIINGDYNARIDKLRQALERIMQGGIQVSLIQ